MLKNCKAILYKFNDFQGLEFLLPNSIQILYEAYINLIKPKRIAKCIISFNQNVMHWPYAYMSIPSGYFHLNLFINHIQKKLITDRQTNKQADRQTNKQAHQHTWNIPPWRRYHKQTNANENTWELFKQMKKCSDKIYFLESIALSNIFAKVFCRYLYFLNLNFLVLWLMIDPF